MGVIDALMENAAADMELLRLLDSRGDDFTLPRTVDFLFIAPTIEKAQLVAGFLNDYGYGVATAAGSDGDATVSVVIEMPIRQNAIRSVSGFMCCISALFGVEYDGWGCEAAGS
jgi:hypothetical protein